jgi:hypothetical protein
VCERERGEGREWVGARECVPGADRYECVRVHALRGSRQLGLSRDSSRLGGRASPRATHDVPCCVAQILIDTRGGLPFTHAHLSPPTPLLPAPAQSLHPHSSIVSFAAHAPQQQPQQPHGQGRTLPSSRCRQVECVGSGFWVQGSGFRVQGLGLRGKGFGKQVECPDCWRFCQADHILQMIDSYR